MPTPILTISDVLHDGLPVNDANKGLQTCRGGRRHGRGTRRGVREIGGTWRRGCVEMMISEGAVA